MFLFSFGSRQPPYNCLSYWAYNNTLTSFDNSLFNFSLIYKHFNSYDTQSDYPQSLVPHFTLLQVGTYGLDLYSHRTKKYFALLKLHELLKFVMWFFYLFRRCVCRSDKCSITSGTLFQASWRHGADSGNGSLFHCLVLLCIFMLAVSLLIYQSVDFCPTCFHRFITQKSLRTFIKKYCLTVQAHSNQAYVGWC